jgi:hypothetical protein
MNPGRPAKGLEHSNRSTDTAAPGVSGQYAIDAWESEGGGPAGARGGHGLAHIALADNAGWRASNAAAPRVNRSPHDKPKDTGARAMASAVADNCEEDQILRALGAAVITRWNTIPTKAATRAVRQRERHR